MKIRKAILTGGGHATRLRPITSTINKHMLPLANKPMIFHAIEKVVAAGITEIFINVNPGETELQQFVGDGGHWGVQIKFFEQTGGPQGIAHVVNEAKHFIGDDPFIFYLSDNILLGGVTEMVQEFNEQAYDSMIALSEVPDPQRFGVPVFNDAGELIDTLEKPEQPPNNFAITGIYIFGPKIFFEAFQKIHKSARGEYEIPSIFSLFLKEGKRVGYKEITGWWKDTGKPEDLLLANALLLEQIELNKKTNSKIHIGTGVQQMGNVELIAPVMIGENCYLNNCKIGPNVTVGSGVRITDACIRDSIILDNATIRTNYTIEQSLIGKSALLAAQTSNSKPHKFLIGDKSIIELVG